MAEPDLFELLAVDPDDPRDVLSGVLEESDEKLIADLAAHRRRHFSLRSVAKRMGVEPDVIRRIESGGRDISFATLRRYSMAIDAVVRHEVRSAWGNEEWATDSPSPEVRDYLNGVSREARGSRGTVTVDVASGSHPYELFAEKSTTREVPVELVAIRERLVRDLRAAPLSGEVVHSVDSSDGEHYTSYVSRSKEGTIQMAVDIVMATIGARIAEVIDICETEQSARHDAYAPVPAVQITRTLDPDTYAPDAS